MLLNVDVILHPSPPFVPLPSLYTTAQRPESPSYFIIIFFLFLFPTVDPTTPHFPPPSIRASCSLPDVKSLHSPLPAARAPREFPHQPHDVLKQSNRHDEIHSVPGEVGMATVAKQLMSGEFHRGSSHLLIASLLVSGSSIRLLQLLHLLNATSSTEKDRKKVSGSESRKSSPVTASLNADSAMRIVATSQQ